MTREEAARILDPATSAEALAEIEYYGGFDGEKAKLEAVNTACEMAAAALRAQAEADEASAAAGWISRKNLPDLGGGNYLVWTRNTGVEKCRWSEKRRRWIGGRWTDQITHWMPLPKPPEDVPGGACAEKLENNT